MNTFEITQSLNWYKSNVMTMDKSGTLLAYGSRSIIVLVRGLEGNSVYDLQYDRLKLNLKMTCGRIGALSFSNQYDTFGDAYYLASIDEVNIYIWNVNNMVCEHVHSFGNKKNKNVFLSDVAWLYECLTLVAISDAGTLYKWDIQALTMRNYTLDVKMSPLTLATCPHEKNTIAIGCKNGNIIVYDLTGNGRILHKLHYHERNIVSLAWCPVPYNPLSSDHSVQPLLLASTACDRTGIYICRAGLDMYSECTVSLPARPLRKTIYKNKTNISWSCIKWIKPTIIIVTSAFGEILKVELPSNKSSEPIVTLISDTHKDVIFSIACSPKSAKPYLWSSCMGRKLIRTPLFNTKENSEFPLDVPTLGGFVYCFALSPVNSADFAFGLGDGRIYYWNVSNKRQLELITLSYSVDSKVLSLAFHPQDEGLLAFGAGDGRIGIINLIRKRNNVNLLKTVLSHPIYRLCWAPMPNKKADNDAKLALYAVGNGQIIIYNDMNLLKDPHNLKDYSQFNEIEEKLTTPVRRIEMAWKPDYNIVAVGNSNGSIYLLDGVTLKLKHVVHGHDQSVECIIWHPTHVTCDYSEESKYKNYFASSSHCIRVHQLNEDDSKPSLVVEFKGSKEKINELAWSPHRNLMLLSCSNDFTAKIWDVQKCTLIGVYSKHLCTVLCGMFSPVDSDIVFTGSADHSVHSWRISKDLQMDKVDSKKNQDTPNIVKEKIVSKDVDSTKTGDTEEQTSKIQQFPLSSYELFIGKHLEKAVDTFIDSHYCENKMSEDDTKINYLAFFGTTEEIKKLLVEEYYALKKKSSKQMVPSINNINIWGQNLEGYFKDAIETKSINDWMIAVAPSISHELWTKMCYVYARQLEDVGDVTKASTYLVAIKKFKEAAMMLLKNNLFREALAVIKSQETQDEKIILEITKKWAEYNIFHGHPKEAAHCYLSIGDARNAISCLIKVKQIKEISLAAKLARYIDEDMEESLVVNILKTEYFKHHKWIEAKELLKNHPKLDYLKMWIDVHEVLFKLDTKVTHKIFINWICAVDNKESSSVFDYILKHVEYKPEYYGKLERILESEFISDTTLLLPKMIVYIAGQFCLIALQCHKTGSFTVDSQRRLIKCLAVAYNYETVYTDSQSKFNKILSRLIMWIFPKGPLTLELYANYELNKNLMKTIRAYLCYTCFSWLNPLYTSFNKKNNLPVEGNCVENIVDNKPFSEMITIIHQYQHLLDKYIHDIVNNEILDYFKAKKDIDRINHLLTTGFSNVESKIDKEFNGCVTSIVGVGENEKIENSVINDKIELTSEANETNMKSLTENVQKCNIINNINCTESNANDEQEKSNDYCKSSQNNKMNNYKNNNTNKRSGVVCKNGTLTQIMHNKVNLNTLCISNSNNSVDISIYVKQKMYRKCKAEVHQFYQNLKSELSKFNYVLNEPTTIKHVAHLEIEASKKKELEYIVAEFEKKWINSPNPFSFVAELKTFIHNYDQQ